MTLTNLYVKPKMQKRSEEEMLTPDERRRRNRPDFPVHNYIELQKSKIPFGDSRHFPWETTYHDAMRPRTRDENRQQLDTIMLQKTHWNPGDYKSTMVSEAHASYPDYKQNVQRTQEITRDMMMRTNFSLDDGETVMKRERQQFTPGEVRAAANLKEQMVATHFDLTTPTAPPWETTHQDAFRRHDCPPAESAQMELNRGLGTKSTFDQLSAFGPGKSLYSETYRDTGRARTAMGTGRVQKATVEGDKVNFMLNTTNKWQRTNFELGDGKGRYKTTSGEATPRRAKNPDVYDPRYAQERRAAFSKSCVTAGNNFETVKTSVMHDSIRPHPDARPPPSAEKTAFVSHQDHRNWNEPITTTMRADFPAKKAEQREPINNHLQDTHAAFGNDKIHELTTLYEDTFRKPPPTMERADMDAARAFHMGHHSKDKSGENVKTEDTVYRRTYVHFKDAKPSDMCDALKGGHNIVANDPRFIVRQSSMKEDFQSHKGLQRPPPIDNSLWDSHLQLKGGARPWTTTQQDYFLYKTYKMPGQPF